MSRHATAISFTAEERAELERRIRARTGSQQGAVRAQIVLRAAAGDQNKGIAAALGIASHTAQHWRDNFAAERLGGLADRPHHPLPRLYGPEIQAKIVVLASENIPELSERALFLGVGSSPIRTCSRWCRSATNGPACITHYTRTIDCWSIVLLCLARFRLAHSFIGPFHPSQPIRPLFNAGPS